uniref:Uncharacterized protein n=1 Tax=viral metagenome TaxID=1070528 RepID=A0A6M3K3D0_9ZZZZ
MDTSKTRFYKEQRGGWNGKDTIDMGVAAIHGNRGEGTRMLQIHTYKRSRGGIHTFASCAIHAAGMMTMDLFGDYSKTVATLDGVKCTEKSIKTLHTKVMAEQADAILAEARAFYAAKDAAKALNDKRDAELARQDAKPLIGDTGPTDPQFPRTDWEYEVTNGDTRLGYDEWLEHKREDAAHDQEQQAA